MKEKYQPNLEEIQNAEEQMTDEQKKMSEIRNEGYQLGKQDTTSQEALAREKQELTEKTKELLRDMSNDKLTDEAIKELDDEVFINFAKNVPMRRRGETGELVREEYDGPQTREIYRLPNGKLASGSMWAV